MRLSYAHRLATAFALCLLFTTTGFAQLTAPSFPTGYDMSGTVLPVKAGNKFFYASNVSGAGLELVTADLNLSSASLVKDLLPGANGSGPVGITPMGDKVVFTASDGLTGRELYISDGRAAGTVRLTDIVAGAGNTFGVNDELFSFGTYVLIQQGGSVYATDGTAAGTRKLAGIDFGSTFIYSVAGRSLLLSTHTSSSLRDSLYLYDYASNRKTYLSRLENAPYQIFPGVRPVNTLSFAGKFLIGFFAQIIISDGTGQGSYTVNKVGTENFFNATEFTYLDGKVYFAAQTTSAGREVFVLDPQTRTVQLAADVNQQNNGADGSSPEALTVYNDTLFFIANDGLFGTKLHKLKGSFQDRAIDAVSGSADLTGAAMDSLPAGLIISRGSIIGSSYMYRNGALQVSQHNPFHFGGIQDVSRRTCLISVPGLDIRLAVFKRAVYPGSDSLVQVMGNGTYRHFAPSQTFNDVASPLDQVAVTSDRVYLASGLTSYLWSLSQADLLAATANPVTSAAIQFYPNPASSKLIYQGARSLEMVRLVDMQGKVCRQWHQVEPGETMQLNGILPGLYILAAGKDGTGVRQRIRID